MIRISPQLAEILLWLWLAGIGAAYFAQFRDYAAPVARLIFDLFS